MSLRCAVLIVATLLSPLAARAAGAAAEIDPNSPRGAIKNFYQAMEAGDPAGVRAALYAKTPEEKELADAYVAQLTAARALGEAAKNKFGAIGDALSKGMPLRDEIARLNSAEETITAETATVKLAGQAKPVRLVKTDGQWRLLVADYAGASGADNIAVQVAVLRDMATAFGAVAADISADKFPNAQEAQRALQQKLQAVLFNTLQKNPPTTAKSTTAPGKSPK
jgi:hypothetical protein